MYITLQLPDDIQTRPLEQQREQIMDAFLAQSAKDEATSFAGGLSKWAKIVQRVENDPIHLANTKQLKKDMADVRENFQFKHDEP